MSFDLCDGPGQFPRAARQALVLVEQSLHRRFGLFPAGAEFPRYRVNRAAGLAIIIKRPHAAKEMDARHLLRALPPANGDQPDFARAFGMCAAARRPVVIGDLDDADAVGYETLFPQRQLCGLFGRDFVDADLAVIEDHVVGQFFGARDGALDLVGLRFERQIDLGRPVGDAEAFGLGAEKPEEGLREDVLARVLLNHFAAAAPVDLTGHLFADGEGNVRAKAMQYPPVVAHLNVDYEGRVDRAGVAGLPASGRVEGRLIERDDPTGALQPGVGDARGEARQTRIF